MSKSGLPPRILDCFINIPGLDPVRCGSHHRAVALRLFPSAGDCLGLGSSFAVCEALERGLGVWCAGPAVYLCGLVTPAPRRSAGLDVSARATPPDLASPSVLGRCRVLDQVFIRLPDSLP